MLNRAHRFLREKLGASSFDEMKLVHGILGHRESAVLVDVGAHYGSSLAPYLEDDWTVHAFEPDPANREVLASRYGSRDKLTINEQAVSDSDHDRVMLYRSGVSTGISSLHAFHDSHVEERTVETITLRTYMAEQGLGRVDLLKIDTEGYELFVLQGFPWEEVSPDVIVAEFEDSKTLSLGYNFTQLADDMVARGYQVFVSEWFPVIQYGQKHSWRSLRQYPCRLSNRHAWGNLIATREPGVARLLKQAEATGFSLKAVCVKLARKFERLL